MNTYLAVLGLALLPLMPLKANATDWYVDGLHGVNGPSGGTQGPTPTCGAKNNVHGTRALPFKDFWCAQQHVRPGDTIHLLPTIVYENLYVTAGGTAGAPITITGDGAAPNLSRVSNAAGSDGNNFAIEVNATSNVVVSNLDVAHRHDPGPLPSSGILLKNSDHIVVSGNVVHNVGGNGITIIYCDYIRVSHNVVHDTAWNTKPGFFNSGIAVLRSVNTDNNRDTYKMIISSNTVYHNYNTPRKPGDPCSPASARCTLYGSDSDGNGIILDRNDDPSSGLPQYNGRSVITNNVVFGNGGRGIHLYLTNHIVVVNNSTFLNNQDPYESTSSSGEIEVDRAGDVQVYNNVAYTDGVLGAIYGRQHHTGNHAGISVLFWTPDMGPVTIDYNLTYAMTQDSTYGIFQRWNASPPNVLSHNVFADPLYVNATKSASVADFSLAANSPGLATATSAYAPPTDKMGNPRPAGRIDRGAYQTTR